MICRGVEANLEATFFTSYKLRTVNQGFCGQNLGHYLGQFSSVIARFYYTVDDIIQRPRAPTEAARKFLATLIEIAKTKYA